MTTLSSVPAQRAPVLGEFCQLQRVLIWPQWRKMCMSPAFHRFVHLCLYTKWGWFLLTYFSAHWLDCVKGLESKPSEEWLRELPLSSLKKGGLRTDLLQLPEGRLWVGLYFQAASGDRMRGNGLKLGQGRFRLTSGRIERIVKY